RLVPAVIRNTPPIRQRRGVDDPENRRDILVATRTNHRHEPAPVFTKVASSLATLERAVLEKIAGSVVARRIAPRRHAELPHEIASEMTLIIEARREGDFREVTAAKQELTRPCHAVLQDIRVGGQSGLTREAANELITTQSGLPGKLRQGQMSGRVRIDPGPRSSDTRNRAAALGISAGRMTPQARDQLQQPRLTFHDITATRMGERSVEKSANVLIGEDRGDKH